MRAWLFLMVGVGGCGGCEGEAAPAPPQESVREREPSSVEEPPPRPSPWPTDLSSLRESLERFDDREGCEADLRARLPTEIAEVLADLAYDAVVEDVCTALDAAKAEDASRCDGLSVRAAREGCRRRVAAWTGTPETCPDARGIDGRDPLCLAWASREPSQCDGVVPADRASCLAVLANDPERCRDDRCRGWVERYGEVVRSEARARRRSTSASITVQRDDGEEETTEAAGLERGVVLERNDCRHELSIAIGRPFDEGPRADVRARIGPGFGVEDVTARMVWTATATEEPLRNPTLSLRGEAERGSRLRGTVRGEHRLGSETRQVTLRFDTWIRDLDALDEGCAPPEG